MIPLQLDDLAGLVGAGLFGADGDRMVTGEVVVDSRLVDIGDLFVALAGEHGDGHEHAADAYARGAVAAITDRPLPGLPCLVVPDPLVALQQLARDRFAVGGPPLTFGVTGSSGKTSTKDLLHQVLSDSLPTLAPAHSYNNEVGLPLTLLRRESGTQVAVLEYSSRGLGHIAFLCSLAAPDVAIVLNVGSAHLGEFGSREVTARAKGELVEAARRTAVLNADDPLVAGMAARAAAGVAVITFGTGPDADVRAEAVELDEQGRARFVLVPPGGGPTAEVALRLHGPHHIFNALASAAALLATDTVPGGVAEIARLLGAAGPRSAWRMEVRERGDGVTVVNDAYNANPESMRAALETLAAMGRGGRRTIAVLGAMAELGAVADEEHRSLGRFAVDSGVDRLIAVGAAAEGICVGADSPVCLVVPDRDAAVARLREELRPGDVVLVKASRSAGLEVVAADLLEEAS